MQVVAGAPDPEAALMRAGVGVGSGLGIVYLSPEQLRIIQEELERMTLAMDVISIEVRAAGVKAKARSRRTSAFRCVCSAWS